MNWVEISIWVQVALTMIIFSFLYRDNPLYKFAEHLFVGLGTGYFIVQQFHGTFVPNLWNPLTAAMTGQAETTGSALAWDFALVIPFLFGIMFFLKFNSKLSWMARWPMAVVVGTFAGLAIIGFAQGDLVAQIHANMLPLFKENSLSDFREDPSLAGFFQVIWNPILIVGVLSSLVYFFFSKPHTGMTGRVATVGIWFLMMSFGASYGATVMTRISLFLERANFTIVEHPTPTWVMLLLVVVLLAIWRMRWVPRSSSSE
jgi:hypothetical protein